MALPKQFQKFEKSKGDKEPKGMKEGSKRDMAMDKKQFGKKPPAHKGMKGC